MKPELKTPKSRLGRRAATTYCRRCGADVLTGLDADIAAETVHLDPSTLNDQDEIRALLAERDTYEVTTQGDAGLRIDRRDLARIQARPAGPTGDCDQRRTVHTTHTCGRILPLHGDRPLMGHPATALPLEYPTHPDF